MDEFGVLVESIGFKSQGKSAPMANLKGKTNINDGISSNFGIDTKPSSLNRSQSPYNSNLVNGSFDDDLDGIFRSNNNRKTQNYGGFDDVFGGPILNSKQSESRRGADGGSMFDLDSVFKGSNNSVAKSSASHLYDDGDDIFGGMPGLKSSVTVDHDDLFGSMASPPRQSDSIDDLLGNFGGMGSELNGLRSNSGKVEEKASEFDDLIPGFGGSSPSSNGANSETSRSQQSSGHSAKSTSTLAEDPFVVLESSSSQAYASSGLSSNPLEQDAGKSSVTSSFDELEDFAMGRVQNVANERSDVHPGEKKVQISVAPVKKATDRVEIKFRHAREVKEKQRADVARSIKVSWEEKDETAMHDAHEREIKAKQERLYSKQKEEKERAWRRIGEEMGASEIENHLESIFSMGAQPSSAPRQRSATVDPVFDSLFQNRGRSEVEQTSSGTSSSTRKGSTATSMVDDFSFFFGEIAPSSEEFQEIEGESEERRRARLNHHLRTQERMAKALAEKTQRDLQTQHEQEERHRLAETLNDDIKRWAAGKEGNLRALLSSLQYVLWPDCGWQQVSLTDLITSSSVKKVYYKATLCVHPDKVQQKGANLEQKYIAEKVFDLLKFDERGKQDEYMSYILRKICGYFLMKNSKKRKKRKEKKQSRNCETTRKLGTNSIQRNYDEFLLKNKHYLLILCQFPKTNKIFNCWVRYHYYYFIHLC